MLHEHRRRPLPAAQEKRHLQTVLARRQTTFLLRDARPRRRRPPRRARHPGPQRVHHGVPRTSAATASSSTRAETATVQTAGAEREQNRRVHLRGVLRQRREVKEENRTDHEHGDQQTSGEQPGEAEVHLQRMREAVRDFQQLVQAQADS